MPSGICSSKWSPRKHIDKHCNSLRNKPHRPKPNPIQLESARPERSSCLSHSSFRPSQFLLSLLLVLPEALLTHVPGMYYNAYYLAYVSGEERRVYRLWTLSVHLIASSLSQIFPHQKIVLGRMFTCFLLSCECDFYGLFSYKAFSFRIYRYYIKFITSVLLFCLELNIFWK